MIDHDHPHSRTDREQTTRSSVRAQHERQGCADLVDDAASRRTCDDETRTAREDLRAVVCEAKTIRQRACDLVERGAQSKRVGIEMKALLIGVVVVGFLGLAVLYVSEGNGKLAAGCVLLAAVNGVLFA